MNKKILSLSLLVALSVGISSCGKSNNEPTPNPPTPVNPPTPTPTPDPNNNNNNNGGGTNNSGNATAETATVTLNLGGAGRSIKINGQTFTANAQGNIYLSGGDYTKLSISGNDLPSITLQGDQISEVSMKEAMAQLKRLTILSKTRDNRSKTLSLDLSGLTSVEMLAIGGYSFGTVDLSKLSALTTLYLGTEGRNSERETSITKVILPTANKIEQLNARSPLTNQTIDLGSLPALKRARLISPKFSKVSFAGSPNLEVVVVSNPDGATPFDLELKNNSKLRDISLNGVSIPNFTVQGTTSLNPTDMNLSNVSVTNLELRNINKEGAIKILQSLNKGALTKAVLPGFGFVMGTDPLVGFNNLKDVTLN